MVKFKNCKIFERGRKNVKKRITEGDACMGWLVATDGMTMIVP